MILYRYDTIDYQPQLTFSGSCPKYKRSKTMQDMLNTSALVSNAPSISSAAMTVDFNASVWTARKKDHKASAEVTDANYADKGVASVSKNLLGDCEELRAVQKFAANTRNIHYSMTMPWSDNGSRLLPTAQYFRYHEVMTDLQNEFARLVDEFLTVYECRSWTRKPHWVLCGTVTSTRHVEHLKASSGFASAMSPCQIAVIFVSTWATKLWLTSKHSMSSNTLSN